MGPDFLTKFRKFFSCSFPWATKLRLFYMCMYMKCEGNHDVMQIYCLSHQPLMVSCVSFCSSESRTKEETGLVQVNRYASMQVHTLSGKVALLAEVGRAPWSCFMPKQDKLPSGPPYASNLYSATYWWSAHTNKLHEHSSMWLSCDHHVTIMWLNSTSTFTCSLYCIRIYTWAEIIGPNVDGQVSFQQSYNVEYNMKIRWRPGIPRTCMYVCMNRTQSEHKTQPD